MAAFIGRMVAAVAAVTALGAGLAGCGTATYESPRETLPTAAQTSAPSRPTAPTTTSTTTTPIGTPTTTTSTTTTSTTTKPTTPPPPPVVVRDYLRLGDSGPKVLALQQRLSSLGYWLGQPDGQFGALTQQAVWAFQKAAGLSRDGQVGKATRAALDAGIRPSAQLRGDGVEIDLARQILLVVRGGRVTLILNTSTGGGYAYPASDGGTAIATTPKGSYAVNYVVDGADTGRLGTLWRPRYFNGGIAVHGAPAIPPYPASHGCARVSNAAIDMIWAQNLMPMGSTVLVR